MFFSLSCVRIATTVITVAFNLLLQDSFLREDCFFFAVTKTNSSQSSVVWPVRWTPYVSTRIDKFRVIRPCCYCTTACPCTSDFSTTWTAPIHMVEVENVPCDEWECDPCDCVVESTGRHIPESTGAKLVPRCCPECHISLEACPCALDDGLDRESDE